MIECPKCYRKIRSVNAWHYCAQVNIDSLFKDKPEELEFIFDKVLAAVVEWPNVNVSATKNCVVFVKTKSFLIVRPMSKVLDLKFYSEEPLHAPFIHACKPWNSKYAIHIRLNKLEDLNPKIIRCLKTAYDLS